MTPWSTSTRPPRRWQAEALPRVVEAAHAGQSAIVSACMGTGKSVLIAEVCRLLAHDNWRIVVTTPTQRLVEQLAETIGAAVPCGRFYAYEKNTSWPVVVACCASAPVLAEQLRDEGISCSVLIADEAHRTQSATMLAAHAALAPYATIGFTATPFLSSERARLQLFEDVLYEYDAITAMAEGVVVKPVLRHYQGNAGHIDDAVVEMVRDVEGPGIINSKDIADAEAFAGHLVASGIPAAAIHSRQKWWQQSEHLEALQAGTFKALVHVDLLTEGVDLPWLRWLAMRQVVGSRVAFCQQVGRVLRAHPGKDRAFVLDPHDLFNEFGLTYEAMVGSVPDRTFRDEAESLGMELAERNSASDPGELPMVLIDRLSSYLRRVCLALQAEGLAERTIKSRTWRTDWVSDQQLQAVARAADWAVIAREPHRGLLSEAARNIDYLNKGDASDLLTTLFTLRRHGRWPDLSTLET